MKENVLWHRGSLLVALMRACLPACSAARAGDSLICYLLPPARFIHRCGGVGCAVFDMTKMYWLEVGLLQSENNYPREGGCK